MALKTIATESEFCPLFDSPICAAACGCCRFHIYHGSDDKEIACIYPHAVLFT